MNIKSGEYEYEITSKDILIDNGSCIQVKDRVTLNCKDLTIPKRAFHQLKKDNLLVLIKKKIKWWVGGIRYYKVKESLELTKQASKKVQALVDSGIPYHDERISEIFDKLDEDISKIEGEDNQWKKK